MSNEVRTVSGWVSESEADRAVDRAMDLEPSECRAIAALCELEIQVKGRSGSRVYADGGPRELYLEPGAFEAVARLAKLVGLRPEQYVEQLIKRHLRSLVPRRR